LCFLFSVLDKFVDFGSRAGRMEAKGCAKSAQWQNARRHFYWATRARVARSAALAALAEASPDSTFQYRSRLLDSVASLEPTTDYREVAEKLDKLDLTATIAQLKADHLTRQLIELSKEDRKATMDGLLRLADHLSEEDRASLVGALQSSPSLRTSAFLSGLNFLELFDL
jgi:acetyl-CoA carboxylase / biotin carboxylase 1